MKALPVLDPKAAAIDVGSEKRHVSIAGDAPKVFGTFTGDLEALRDWFQQAAVRTVAMEATGVYWLYLYEVLEAAGLEVVVVNGRHVQNVPGRKTDRADCQWLATLHAHPSGPATSVITSPGSSATSSRVLLPTACMTRAMVPAAESASAMVSGMRSAPSPRCTMTNWPGCRIWAMRGATTSSRVTLGLSWALATMLGMPGS
jgi:hypothetical protein